MTNSELAKELGIEKGNLSKQTAKLVRKGLVRYLTRRHYGRLIELTDSGESGRQECHAEKEFFPAITSRRIKLDWELCSFVISATKERLPVLKAMNKVKKMTEIHEDEERKLLFRHTWDTVKSFEKEGIAEVFDIVSEGKRSFKRYALSRKAKRVRDYIIAIQRIEDKIKNGAEAKEIRAEIEKLFDSLKK